MATFKFEVSDKELLTSIISDNKIIESHACDAATLTSKAETWNKVVRFLTRPDQVSVNFRRNKYKILEAMGQDTGPIQNSDNPDSSIEEKLEKDEPENLKYITPVLSTNRCTPIRQHMKKQQTGKKHMEVEMARLNKEHLGRMECIDMEKKNKQMETEYWKLKIWKIKQDILAAGHDLPPLICID